MCCSTCAPPQATVQPPFHPPIAGFPPESLFSGEGVLLAEHVPTEWGTHTLVEAARELLWAAAADPMNQRCVQGGRRHHAWCWGWEGRRSVFKELP